MWLISMDQVTGDLPYELTRGSHTIGRSRTCDLVIRDDTLSRQHARIWLGADEQIVLEDLGSKNGTFVNDVRIMQQPVKPKAILRLGEIRIFLSSEEPNGVLDSFEGTKSARRDRDRPMANLPVESLTAAQKKVFGLLVVGHDEPAIARILNRSVHTIHLHIQAIFRKLGIHSRADLLAIVIRSQHNITDIT